MIYQRWGGELEGVGRTLATYLKNPEYDLFDDLVARFIRKYREDKTRHPFYIYPAIAGQKADYNYYVKEDRDSRLIVQVNDSGYMSVDELLKMCETNTGTAYFIASYRICFSLKWHACIYT